MSQTFAVQLAAFRDKTKAQMQAVLSASVQDLLEEAQLPIAQGGRMPVDTGFLRNSLASELNGAQLATGASSYALVAAQMDAGDIARFAWTAVYAMRQEFGFVGTDEAGRTYNQAGKHFAEGAAAQWQSIVARNAARFK